MIYDQLTFAREYRELTQTELTRRVPGLYQSNLSAFERGVGTLSAEMLSRIMNCLGFPKDFLRLKLGNQPTHFRKNASINATGNKHIQRFISLVAYILDNLFDEMELPAFRVPQIDLSDGTSPEAAARIVRRRLRLRHEPVKHICNLLERNGVFIYEWDCPYNEFSGVSLPTDNGYYLIIVNRNHSADRRRYTLAHELGHIVMHAHTEFVILPSRNMEQEANRFAGEFLMPEEAVRNSLLQLSPTELPALKRIWLVSMQSIAYRAKFLQLVDDNRYRYMMTYFSKNNWRKNEPVDVFIDTPTVVRDTKQLAVGTLGYGIEEMARHMSLPTDILEEVLKERTLRIKPAPMSA